MIKACQLTRDRVRVRLPIQKDLINAIIEKIQQEFEHQCQPYLSTLYSAIFVTAYYRLFRIGEVASGPHVMKVMDVSIADNKNKLIFVLHTSKTHNQGSKPQTVTITSVNSTESVNTGVFCPYALMRKYLSMRRKYRKENEQFFAFRDRSAVKPEHLRAVLHMALDKLEFDSSLYCFHGIRVGRALDLLHLGLSVETIKKMGRWKSNCVYTYLKY